MLLVIDTNLIISALISKGTKQDILFSDSIIPITPDWVLFEIGKNWKIICEKTKFSIEDLDISLLLIRNRLKQYPLSIYNNNLREARDVSPHSKDDELFALALALNCAIWSDEKAFKKQEKVKVFTSEELAKKLGLPWK